MKKTFWYECISCGKKYKATKNITYCRNCGSPLIIRYPNDATFDKSRSKSIKDSIWRYWNLLPLHNERNIVSLGEGWTHLLKASRLSSYLGVKNLYLKNETTNPTGSFIDRGVSVAVSFAKEAGYKGTFCITKGNLGVSLAAYSAKADLKATIFIDRNIEIGKLYQIIAYGADVNIITEGKFTNTDFKNKDIFNLNAENPFIIEGKKTTIFEILEQMNWAKVDKIIVPFGSGGHIYAIWKGINELKERNVIGPMKVQIFGIKPKSCESSDNKKSIAIDLCIPSTKLSKFALNAIKETNGDLIYVSDEEILQSMMLLAHMEGIFAEPSAAITIAGLQHLLKKDLIEEDETIVSIITGFGLKNPRAIRILSPKPRKINSLIHNLDPSYGIRTMGRTKLEIMNFLNEKTMDYGYGIWKKLIKKGINLTLPAVYQHLNELEKLELITKVVSFDESTQKKKVFYKLTRRGLNLLRELYIR